MWNSKPADSSDALSRFYVVKQKVFLEVHTYIDEEVAVADSVKFALSNIGKTKVEADFCIQHLILYATANAQTSIKAVAVVAESTLGFTRVFRVYVFVLPPMPSAK